MTFGEKLKFYRNRLNLTQAEFAKKVGLGTNTIINYEKGNTYPRSKDVYTKIAEAIGVPEEAIKDDAIEVESFFTVLDKHGLTGDVSDVSKVIADQNGNTIAVIPGGHSFSPNAANHSGVYPVVEFSPFFPNTRNSVPKTKVRVKRKGRAVPAHQSPRLSKRLDMTNSPANEALKRAMHHLEPAVAGEVPKEQDSFAIVSPAFQSGALFQRASALLAGDRMSDEDRSEVLRILKKYEY